MKRGFSVKEGPFVKELGSASTPPGWGVGEAGDGLLLVTMCIRHCRYCYKHIDHVSISLSQLANIQTLYKSRAQTALSKLPNGLGEAKHHAEMHSQCSNNATTSMTCR